MKEMWKSLLDIFSRMTIFDFIDIFIVGLLIFLAYRFISERRAGKLALGIIMLVALATLSEILKLRTIAFLMSNLFQVGIIAIIIVFQPELRSALEKVGGVQEYINQVASGKDGNHMNDCIDVICSAVCDMSLDKTGALIVFERSTKLGDIIKSGTLVDADISANLIKNIFYKNSPLHDGAMIIRDGRIRAAKCMLPLTTNPKIDREFATRHRAAIGMSENSDAVVVVVSEQTGIISIAYKGELTRNYDYRKLHDTLVGYLIQTPANNAGAERKPRLWSRGRKKQSSDSENGEA